MTQTLPERAADRLPGARSDDEVSIVYSSSATVPFSDEDLAELLRRSRTANEARGVTGLLLHHAGQFMQVLEGPEAVVRAVLTRIAADPRHTGVWVLAEERIETRRFPDWAMGYRPATDLTSLPGFNGSIMSADAFGTEWLTSTRVEALLDWFRRR